MDPAYKATVTDLLTPEQYTKASGLIGIAGLRQIPGITHPGRFPSHAV